MRNWMILLGAVTGIMALWLTIWTAVFNSNSPFFAWLICGITWANAATLLVAGIQGYATTLKKKAGA